MKALAWIKLQTDALDDPKLLLLAPSDRWYFLCVCQLKGKGIVDSGMARLDDAMAVKMRLTAIETAELKRRLIEGGLIDEKWQPLAWDKNQPTLDNTATERKQRQRDRERSMSQNVTRDTRDCHGTELEEELELEEEPTLSTSNQDLPLEADASLGQPAKNSIQPEAEPERQGQAPTAKTAKTPKTASIDARGTRLGDFPLTPDRWKFAEQQGIADPKRTHLMFCNYWRAKSGREARKVDWDATWQNWCLKDASDQRNRKQTFTQQRPAERRSQEFPS